MSDTTYNGWTNYETWNVKLWLDNEQSTYYDVTRHASDVYTEAMDMEEAPDAYDLAAWLKDYVTDMAPELPASMFSDLLNAALSEVNWQEIAEVYLSDAKEEANA